MKCGACGYHYKEPVNGDTNMLESHGDEEFIEIGGNYTIKNKHSPFDVRRVHLLTCPRCGVVNMGDW